MFGRNYHTCPVINDMAISGDWTTRTYDLNAADDWLGISFLAPPDGATLNKVLVYASGVTGAPLTDAKLECHVFSALSGSPNASLSSTVTVTAKPGAAGWVEFTGLTQALTGGVQYWIVLKNIEADPTTKFPTYRTVGYAAGRTRYNVNGPLESVMTANAGTAWATDARYCVGGMRLEFSDGSFLGLPVSNADGGSSTYAIYGNREHGAYFTTPAAGQLVVAGASASVKITSNPGNGIQFRLYKGTTLVDTSKEVLVTNMQTTVNVFAMFTAARTLDVNSAYRITVRHSGEAGDSSNYYTLGYLTNHDSDASRALLPLGGWAGTYTTNATASPPFSDTPAGTIYPNIGLMLDGDGIITAAAGGGGGARIIGG